MKFLMGMLVFAVFVTAAPVAVIEKIQGDVRILAKGSIKREHAQENMQLVKGDMVITYKDSMAALILDNGTGVKLDQRTRLRITNAQTIAQESGQAFFDVSKQKQKDFKVATDFATIGVKGTTFIVSDTNSSKNVALKKGLVDIISNEGEFELHRKRQRELTAYEKYKMQLDAEFKAYKAKLIEEFVEYKKQFELKPNQQVRFDGKKVYEDTFDAKIEEEFDKFETF